VKVFNERDTVITGYEVVASVLLMLLSSDDKTSEYLAEVSSMRGNRA
jgi:hypothetical protein